MSLSKKIVLLIVSFFLPLWGGAVGGARAGERLPKDSIYQGMIVKLDAGSAIVVPAATGWKIQNYEIAMNWRVIQRLYPTFELGYAGGAKIQGDTLSYRGHGGFFRAGLDINPLKRHPESPHALLVGVRLGTAVQQINQENAHVAAPTYRGVQADCWGEIVAGCQVEVARLKHQSSTTNRQWPMAFYMGWMGRLKCLFTRRDMSDRVDALHVPIYIPGFGARDNIGWGVDYYVGWRF